MGRVLIADLRKHVGQIVTICGWVNALRLQRKMQFVLIRDPTGLVQITHRRSGEGDVLESAIGDLTPQSAVRIIGRVLDNPIVNLGGLEVIPESVEVLNRSESPLPIDEHSGPDHRLDWRFLDVRLRSPARLVFDVQTTVERAMREYAYREGFTEMHTPKLMGTASESGAEVFRLSYFGQRAYLAQSPLGVAEQSPVLVLAPAHALAIASSQHPTRFVCSPP